ncbi:peptidase M18, aminopeptidase I [Sistotremastrum niveocremeum HHB9708]|uniref:Peptidase M18, aminopeptidase I n=1 Tax=Sistotremastrum niveocremeum HHB9708 TaxID=1314777 RepID=A0A164QY39_9AGAM|nr:peptidase M18, aminopeptidase I [Sistotremastrum niveocremeum HHB9708]
MHTREDDVLSLDEESTYPYAPEFLHFIDEAATVYHAADYFKRELIDAGYVELKESEDWIPKLKLGGKYYLTRNSSTLLAFAIGSAYKPGSPVAFIASHIDALCLKVKPVSNSGNAAPKGGFDRLGVAPYAGGGGAQRWDGSYSTWWDRDLGLGGRVLVQTKDGSVKEKLVKLPNPVARIPSLAVHFGEPARGPFNYETQMVPIIGLTRNAEGKEEIIDGSLGKLHSARVLKAVAHELGVNPTDIVDFDLELFDFQKATLLGLSGEFISAPRLDDKLCSFSALTSLINATSDNSFMASSEVVSMVGLFDMEEVGSGLRQGAKGNLVQTVINRIVEAQVGLKEEEKSRYTTNLIGQTLGRSFMISADVTHAYNPNFDGIYLEGAAPALNKGVVIAADPNGHMTTDASCNSELQLFQIRNDSRSGGTVGPTLSERLGCRSIDMSIPQLSMHSIRAMTGAGDPGIGVQFFEGFFRGYQAVQAKVLVQ